MATKATQLSFRNIAGNNTREGMTFMARAPKYPTEYGKGIDNQDSGSNWFGKTAVGKWLGTAGSRTFGDSAEAGEANMPKKPGSPVGPMGSGVQQRRGSPKAAPSYGKSKPAAGATSGSITKPSKSYSDGQKKRGAAYLAQDTDYGMGSALNSFVNKKK